MNNTDCIVDLSPLGLLEVSGVDAAKFLQGQLTCDVREVTDQQSCLGAHCDPKGRVQFTFRLFKFKDCYYLRLARNLIPQALSLLNKYLIFSKTKLADVSDQWLSFGLSGSNCQQQLAAVSDLVISKPNEVATIPNLIALGLPGTPFRIEVIGKADSISALKENLQKKLTTADFQQWQLVEIEAGIPSITPETAGLFTPHDISFPQLNGVSFNKGCYTGQEIVARMHYLGKPKQNLYRLQIQAEQFPVPGSKIYTMNNHEKREVGCLVNVAGNSAQGYWALAVLQDAATAKPLYLENSAAILISKE